MAAPFSIYRLKLDYAVLYGDQNQIGIGADIQLFLDEGGIIGDRLESEFQLIRRLSGTVAARK